MRVLRKLFCAALVLGALSGCVTTDGSAPTRSAASEAEYAKQMELGRAHLRERRRPEAFEAFLAAAEAKPGDKEAIAACTVLARFENKTEVWLDSLSRQLSKADEVGKSQIYGAQVTALWDAKRPQELEVARKNLIELWRATNNRSIKAEKSFTRTFVPIPGGGHVRISENYELTPPRAVRYIFQHVTQDLRQGDVVTLGTYDFTTDVMREIEKRPADWRMWHLDYYSNGGRTHGTLGMYPNGEPPLEAILEHAIARLTRQR